MCKCAPKSEKRKTEPKTQSAKKWRKIKQTKLAVLGKETEEGVSGVDVALGGVVVRGGDGAAVVGREGGARRGLHADNAVAAPSARWFAAPSRHRRRGRRRPRRQACAVRRCCAVGREERVQKGMGFLKNAVVGAGGGSEG